MQFLVSYTLFEGKFNPHPKYLTRLVNDVDSYEAACTKITKHYTDKEIDFEIIDFENLTL